MVCFMDIQHNSAIARLPCHHILHRDCATQNLLYSRVCPGCAEPIVFPEPQPAPVLHGFPMPPPQ